MKQTVESITPTKALEYLEVNKVNRPFKPATYISNLASQMRRGEWMLTHQGIAFDTNGMLQDGQNRLAAIIESGRTIDIMVTRGCPVENFKVLDTGERRTVSDILKVKPAAGTLMSAIAALVFSGKGKVPISLVEKINVVFGPLHYDLTEFAPSTTKVYASTKVRLAAIARIASGVDKEFVFNAYKAFSAVDIENMSPIARSLAKQIFSGDAKTSGGGYDFMLRCWYVFDPTRTKSNRVVVAKGNTGVADITAVFRKELERFYPGALGLYNGESAIKSPSPVTTKQRNIKKEAQKTALSLRVRFSRLIDIDRTEAEKLLDTFGVPAFTSLDPSSFPMFSSKLDKLGV